METTHTAATGGRDDAVNEPAVRHDTKHEPAVRHVSGQLSGAGGTRLHLQAWLPGPPGVAETAGVDAVIAVVHGYGDHGGRYAWFGEAMAARGYAVYVYDLRGHGHSSGTRGQVKTFDEYLDDTEVFLGEVRRRQPGRPLFLLGHSMGGLIAARLVQERSPELSGLVLSSPFLALVVDVPPSKVVGAKLLAVVWPGKDVGNTVQAADLSHDQGVVESYVTDPLVHHVAPARWAVKTLAAQDAAMAGAGRITAPLYLLYGKDDPVADPAFAEELVARAASGDKTVRAYDDLLHECFNETGREQVYADLAAWLAARVSAAGG
jgi:alpha-beta hydrolase superfamily lysophospholipase